MSTDKRAFVERMETREKNLAANARGYACAELFLLLTFALCMIAFIVALNAVLPPDW